MASTTAFCDSFKLELMKGEHDLTVTTGDSFKMALYEEAATNDRDTTVYTATQEISGTNYVAGGAALTVATSHPLIHSGTTAIQDFDDVVWSTATFTAYSALIYNDTHASDAALSVHDFAGTGGVTATGADFTVQFPDPTAADAVIRIA